MAFCGSCGAPMEGKFCARCGATVGGAPSPASPPAYTPPLAPATGGLTENVAAALCYLPFAGLLISVIFLLVEPYKAIRNVRFAAFQSIFLWVCMFVIWIALDAFWSVSWTMVAMLHTIVRLFGLVLGLYLAYKAYQNEKVVLPIIGPLAEKQA